MRLSTEQKRLAILWSATASSDTVAQRLRSEHGVTVSGAAIRKLVQKTRDERQVVTQAAAAVQLGEHVTSDLDALLEAADIASDMLRRTYKMATEFVPEGTARGDASELVFKALDRVDKLRSTRLKAAGLGGEGGGRASSADELPKESEARAKLFRALAEREENRR